MEAFDVIVAGGGPAGSICAATLAREGWRVLLAEANESGRARLADTLSPAAARRLQRLLGPCELPPGIATPCRGVVADWGTHSIRVTDHELDARGAGLTISRPEIDRLLTDRAKAVGAVLRLGWRGLDREYDDNSRRSSVRFVTPQGRATITARFFIDATGRNSSFNRATRTSHEPQLAYSIAIPGRQSGGMLRVERTTDGWWYLNDLPEGGVQLVFITNSLLPGRQQALRLGFLERLFEKSRFLRPLVGPFPSDAQISACDARVSRMPPPPRPGFLAIGDAAIACDPLSGQGWMRALESASDAAAAISSFLNTEDTRTLDEFSANTARLASMHLTARAHYLTESRSD